VLGLDVDVDTLLAGDEPLSTHLVRAAEGEWLSFESSVPARLILADGRERRIELLELALEAGAAYESQPHAPGTEELVVCVKGTLEVGPRGHEARLRPGDPLQFAADVPHVYGAARGGRALCWFSYPVVHSG
jgi:XRE family transcriptional regulator, regulator of sulfur utilization